MHEINHVSDVIVLLSTAVCIVAVFKKLKLSPVLGYFVAGTIIGDHGMAIVKTGPGLDLFAEMGIVFLLFIIGLELTYERLIAMRHYVFGFGGLQVLFTSLTLAFVFLIMGHSTKSSAVIGGGLCLSSTAIVLQVLKENGKQSTQLGRLAVANLLMQDFAVVPLLVLVPLLSQNSNDVSLIYSLLMAFAKASLALVCIFTIGRLLFRPLFNFIASFSSDELFIATTILIVIASAYTTERMDLSMALGAFVSGLMVAETTYRHEVEKAIMPFKSLLLGLFFMTVGMSLDINLLVKHIGTVSMLVTTIIVIKATIIYLLARAFGFNGHTAIQSGLLLSQGSEFAFILFNLSRDQGLIAPEIAQVLMVAVTATMAITPLMTALGTLLSNLTSLSCCHKKCTPNENSIRSENYDIESHVIVVGFDVPGKITTLCLEADQINHVVLEINIDRVNEGQQKGRPTFHGDVNNLETLRALNADKALAVIITVKNEVTVKKAIKTINEHFPNLKVIAKASNNYNSDNYMEYKIEKIIPIKYEEGLQMGAAALAAVGLHAANILTIKESLRENSYDKINEELK